MKRLSTGTVANNDRCDIVHMPAIWAIRCNARVMRPEETVIQAPCTGFSTALVDTGYCKRRRASCPTGARDRPDAFPAPGSEWVHVGRRGQGDEAALEQWFISRFPYKGL